VGSEEELLVVAMETAAGAPFDDIIDRIWVTLNDGVPLTRRSRSADIQWTALAFLVVCYLHRYYVPCPEPLLRRALLAHSRKVATDYVDELKELRLGEGWHIFRLSTQRGGAREITLVGALHPRVAARAWQRWPASTVDPTEWVAVASMKELQCVPQVADFMVACQSTIDPRDRMFVSRIAELWDDRRVSTAQLCALVRGVRPSRAAVLQFRRLLRQRLNLRDSESWLAAVELADLAQKGSVERDKLEKVDIPSCLTRANLAAGSDVAIELLGKRYAPTRRAAFMDTLCASLRGELDWQVDGTLLVWLIRNHDTGSVEQHLPHIYSWLESRPAEVGVRVALLTWYSRAGRSVARRDFDSLLAEVRSWAYLMADHAELLLAFLRLAEVISYAGIALPEGLFDEIRDLVLMRPANAHLTWRFVIFAATLGEQAAVAELLDTGLDPVDASLLERLLRSLDVQVLERRMPDVYRWLEGHPGEVGARVALLQRLPESEWFVAGGGLESLLNEAGSWTPLMVDSDELQLAFIGMAEVLINAGVAIPDSLVEAILGWVQMRPGDPRLIVRFVWFAAKVPDWTIAEARLLAAARTWLADHPDSHELHVALDDVLRGMPGSAPGSPAADARAGSGDDAGSSSVRVALLGVVRGIPGRSLADAVDEARSWLRGHPGDLEVRRALLGAMNVMSDESLADLVEESRSWLRDHPDTHDLRVALLGAVRAMPEQAAVEFVEESRSWLREHPDNQDLRVALLGAVRGMLEEVTVELVEESRSWLCEHPAADEVRRALQVPGY
jgi:hypothetical protein